MNQIEHKVLKKTTFHFHAPVTYNTYEAWAILQVIKMNSVLNIFIQFAHHWINDVRFENIKHTFLMDIEQQYSNCAQPVWKKSRCHWLQSHTDLGRPAGVRYNTVSPKIVPKIVPFLCDNREDRRQDAEHQTDRPLSAIERLKSSFYLCVWNCHIQISNYTVLD